MILKHMQLSNDSSYLHNVKLLTLIFRNPPNAVFTYCILNNFLIIHHHCKVVSYDYRDDVLLTKLFADVSPWHRVCMRR